MSGLQYMSGLDVFICIVLLAHQTNKQLRHRARQIWFQLKHLHLSVWSARCTCSLSTRSLQRVQISKGQKSDWVGQMQDSTLHCIPDCSVTHHMFLGEHSYPFWMLGPSVWDTTPTLFPILCVHTAEVPCAGNLPWWPGDSLESPSKKHQQNLLEVWQDASVTHSSSFIQSSVLWLTTWISFMAKNEQDSECTDSLTFLCLSEGTSSI